ncbi:Oligopeptide transport system permease protein [hydrothermal vent metagenome]|jgi:peptide/nickel transport system permease protein|uniref:Oligopeptide transport system permease protein n=1 Tax=hydrothermal vent metagenome TaxID=652676 RepID=A0A1W1DR59_9ZZZZ
MTFVWLWTDFLLWVLFALSMVAVVKIRGNELLLQKWQKIFAQPLALSAFIVFAFYILVGLSDSIHFRLDNNTTTYSVLDRALLPALEAEEKTYSTPLNFEQFSKEYLDNGLRGRVHLNLVSDEITNASDNNKNLLTISANALFYATAIFVAFILFLEKFTSINTTNNRSALATIFTLLFFCTWVVLLMPNYHILGTDKAGIDVFYKAVKSIRTGMVFGLLTTLLALPPAIILGLMAGYFKGKTDDVIQYVYTTINAIPGILLIAALVLILQVYMDEHASDYASALERSDLKLLLLCVILALTSWTGLCRLIRAETLKLSELEFVQAAKVFGVSNIKILFNHLMPNVMHLVLISIVLDFSGLVLIEAVLSYVGVGVDATTMSWGNMINAARLELSTDPVVWWPLASSFIFMFILVLSANLFADRVRQVFDPKGDEDA